MKRNIWIVIGLGVLLLLVTGGTLVANNLAGRPEPTATVEEVTPTASNVAIEEEPTPTVAATETESEPEEEIMTEDDRPRRLEVATQSWDTNWNKHIVPYDELISGGPPRDGIPSIDEPQFVSPEAASEWLAGNEPVIALEIDGEARAYPLQIMTWHEIVNDTVADVPVLVTFCPLCNAALTFDRRVAGETYEFGTSGLLRNSDLVMYDRTTESLWQQLTGQAIVGDMVGHELTFLPSSLVSFENFQEAYPGGVVLSRETGHRRPYGENPYVGYDTIGQSPFLFDGEEDPRLPAMERVVTVELNGTDVAYPLSVLAEQGVVHDTQAGQDLVVFFEPGTSSALGARYIAEAEDVGATGVFDPNLDRQKLTFAREDGEIVDEQTSSTWNILGQAVDGPLAGERLTPIVHGNHFWFAWAAFKPETIVYQGN